VKQGKLCIKTAAGEHQSWVLPINDESDHTVHAPLRIGLSKAMQWVDEHVDWSPSAVKPGVPYPVIKRDFHGNEDWEIVYHPEERACRLCA